VIAQSAAKAVASAPKVATNHAANVQNVANALQTAVVKVEAKAVVHVLSVKTATVAIAKRLKAKTRAATHPPQTSALKPKQKCAPRHAPSASPVKSAANKPHAVKAATSRANHVAISPVVNVPLAVKAVAASVLPATTSKLKAMLCPWPPWMKTKSMPKPRLSKAKPVKTTAASVVSADHATVMAVTAVNVANAPTAHHAKKALCKKLCSTPPMLNKHHARCKKAVHPRMRLRHKSVPQRSKLQQPLHVAACHACKPSPCPWQRCKPWHTTVVWNGSTPIQRASQPFKLPSQPNPSRSIFLASAQRLW